MNAWTLLSGSTTCTTSLMSMGRTRICWAMKMETMTKITTGTTGKKKRLQFHPNDEKGRLFQSLCTSFSTLCESSSVDCYCIIITLSLYNSSLKKDIPSLQFAVSMATCIKREYYCEENLACEKIDTLCYYDCQKCIPPLKDFNNSHLLFFFVFLSHF